MRFGMDVGGTFTDVVAVGPAGMVEVGKVRSVSRGVADTAWETMASLGQGEGRLAGAALIHGTTVATNALLERRGGRTVLVTTAGFEDLLWLRRQDRADLYDLSREHPLPLVARDDVIGVAERSGATGILLPLTASEVERVVHEVARRQPEAVAISLLFSFRESAHEGAIAAAIRARLPDLPVAVSSEVLPVFREYERTSTTTVEAFLRPTVSGYLERMGREAQERALAELSIMASNGGTLSADHARSRAAALALSGPAGGVEGARLVGAQLGLHDLLTLDMGGTSADASVVVAGEPLMRAAGSVGGVPLALPHVLIETVGAGGGSIAWVDAGGALKVGPQSAGAVPGPACYGLGGTDATVTDAALVLGWLDLQQPLADGLRLDLRLAREAVARVATLAGLSLERCAEGIVEVATATMVRALRCVSVERGLDPRQMTLVPFGGAGPMFACRLADQLGMARALVPPHAGVLSALGLAVAPPKIEFSASVHRLASECSKEDLNSAYSGLESQAIAALPRAALRRFADCRYPGQGYELTVEVTEGPEVAARTFHDLHRERYGHADPTRAVEIVNVRIVASRPGLPLELTARPGPSSTGAAAGADHVALDALAPGERVAGPVTVCAQDFTLRIERGWAGTVHATGAIVLERT